MFLLLSFLHSAFFFYLTFKINLFHIFKFCIYWTSYFFLVFSIFSFNVKAEYLVYLLYGTDLFLYHLQIKNFCFSDVFRGYINGLMDQLALAAALNSYLIPSIPLSLAAGKETVSSVN